MWELKLYFYPPAGGFEKKKKKKRKKIACGVPLHVSIRACGMP